MVNALSPLLQPFSRRVDAPGPLASAAFRMPRGVLALVFALLPAVILVGVAFLAPDGARGVATPENVHNLFGRALSAVAASATIAVALATFTFRREVAGVGEVEARYDEDLEFRDRIRKETAPAGVPLALAPFLESTLLAVADAVRRVRGSGPAESLAIRADDIPLESYLEALETTAGRTAERVRRADGNPSMVLAAALEFEQKKASQLARRFERNPDLPDAVGDAMAALRQRIRNASLASFYAKSLTLQWGLSRMSTEILLTLFPSLATAAVMSLAYTDAVPAVVGVHGATLLVAAALGILFFPLALFTSHVLRFVFINQYTLPTAGFVLGPEAPEGVGGGRPGQGSRARHRGA